MDSYFYECLEVTLLRSIIRSQILSSESEQYPKYFNSRSIVPQIWERKKAKPPFIHERGLAFTIHSFVGRRGPKSTSPYNTGLSLPHTLLLSSPQCDNQVSRTV